MFQIDYFKVVANELPIVKFNDKNIITAIYRTTVGRYYYYIFLKYREQLRNILTLDDKTELDKPSINNHILIQSTLKYYDETGIAEKLAKLRRLRNNCDYELFAIIDDKTIYDAKVIVAFLENKLDSIKPGKALNEAFTKALTELFLMKPTVKPK
ncbi:MAG: hypothetical protein HQK89_09330 [Nitrospirae bacterium]|nr:hypothetical protein [Nitrospirota bacterium]